MNPASSSVSLVARMIFDIFDVTEKEAQDSATGLVALAEGWGGVGAAPHDWSTEIKKHFGARLKWRSEIIHQQFLDDKKKTITAYESYIQAIK
jgi:hypothetical protein